MFFLVHFAEKRIRGKSLEINCVVGGDLSGDLASRMSGSASQRLIGRRVQQRPLVLQSSQSHSGHSHTPPSSRVMSTEKLKSLKVVDLKQILSNASVHVPAKSNKNDLIAKIQASTAAMDAYNSLYPADDLLVSADEYVVSS